MSSGGVSAERAAPWRRSSAQGNVQQQQHSSNRSASGSNTPRDRANTPKAAAGDGGNRGQGQNAQKNAAGGATRRDNGAGPAGNAKAAQAAPQSTNTTSSEGGAHVPVNGFNADDIRGFMKKSYAQSVADAGGDEKSLQVKLSESSQPKKAAPWGARPANQMTSGQNFFLELSKQVKAQDDAGQKSSAQPEQSRKGN